MRHTCSLLHSCGFDETPVTSEPVQNQLYVTGQLSSFGARGTILNENACALLHRHMVKKLTLQD